MATTPPRLPIGQRRDFQGMERTRLRAARMFEHGTSQAEVARRLGTSRQNAHRWYRKWQHGGRAALRAAGRAGRTPKLDARARRKVERALLQGALAHGFDSDLWTCKRVVIVIERLTGVRHHPSHAWRILRAMGWTLQRPERRAAERDEDTIARWVTQDWPRIRQNARRRGAWLVFLDESGVGFTPPVRRTWAPRGHTPILRHRQRHWARLSMAAMCCYRACARAGGVVADRSRAAAAAVAPYRQDPGDLDLPQAGRLLAQPGDPPRPTARLAPGPSSAARGRRLAFLLPFG